MAVKDLLVRLGLRSREFERGMGKANKDMGTLKKRTQGVSSAFGALKRHWIAAAAGFAGLVLIARNLTKAFMEQEDAENALTVAMKNANTYTEANFESLKRYASQLQEVTTYGDEVTISTMANLQAYGMNTEELKAATKATMDLATAKKIDLRAASELIGKAFVGETGTLSRYGIVLGKGIEKTEKFGAVLNLVNKYFGGAAQARLKTYAGKLDQIAGYWSDIREEIGKGILDAFLPIIEATRKWIIANKDLIAQKIEDTFEDIATALGKIKTAYDALDRFFGGEPLQVAGHAFDVLAQNVKDAQSEVNKFQRRVDLLTLTVPEYELLGLNAQLAEAKERLQAAIAIYEKAQTVFQRPLVTAPVGALEAPPGAPPPAITPPPAYDYAAELKAQLEASTKSVEIEMNRQIAMIDIRAAQMDAQKQLQAEALEAQNEATNNFFNKERELAAQNEVDMQAYFNRRKAMEENFDLWRRETATNWVSFSEDIAMALFILSGRQNKALFLMTRAASMVKGTIAAHLAFTLALANPPGPPWTYPVAYSALAAGLAKVAVMGALTYTEVQKMHKGGIVGQDFASAPRLHTGGFAPDEVPVILQKGEEVIPREKVGRTEPMELTLHNYINLDGRQIAHYVGKRAEWDTELRRVFRRAIG